MKKLDILILVIWIFFISNALLQGLGMDKPPLGDKFPFGNIKYLLWIFPFIFFVFAFFSQRRTAFKSKFLTKLIDNKCGIGTYDTFINRLRPTILFMSFIFTIGISGLLTTYFSDGPQSNYTLCGFFISGGFGILVAFLLSLKFPPTLR